MLEPVGSESFERLGRYEILQEIGRGAMGVVYLAQDPLIGRQVALKVFRVGFSATDDELHNLYARFIREAQSAGILSHPNIVTVHDVAQAGDESPAFIAMEYVEGCTLKEVLDAPEEIEQGRALDLVLQVAAALDYAHSMGVVHRDIKPGNILVTAKDDVKITDFGIAVINACNVTHHGQLLGTPNYMAPEAIEDKSPDHRADLFSLGVVLYELLTGQKPFAGDNVTKVTHRIVHEGFTPPMELVADVPAAVEHVVSRLLEKNPDDRFQSAAELVRALEAAVSGGTGPIETSTAAASGPGISPVETQTVQFDLPEQEPPPPTLSRVGAALRRTMPLGRVPAWVLIGGVVLGISVGILLWSARSADSPSPNPRPRAAANVVAFPAGVSALEPLTDRKRRLELSAAVRLETGDVEGAYFDLLEALRIDPVATDLRGRLREVESLVETDGARSMAQVEEHLTAARGALGNGRIRDAVASAELALELDPMSLEAPELIAAAGAEGDRIRARRQAVQPPSVAAVEEVEPVVQAEPKVVQQVVEEQPPAPPVATTGSLVVELTAQRSPGVITLYMGEEQIFRERFKFVGEKKRPLKLLTGKGIAGELRRELIREPGDLQLRLYVSMPGEPTQVLPLEGRLEAGGVLGLQITIDAEGRASARVE